MTERIIGCSQFIRLQICDSLYNGIIKPQIIRSMKSLYSECINSDGKINVTVLPVQRQGDGYNCGVFAVAFAADIINDIMPSVSVFDVVRMQSHLIDCLETQQLSPFPKSGYMKTPMKFKIIEV